MWGLNCEMLMIEIHRNLITQALYNKWLFNNDGDDFTCFLSLYLLLSLSMYDYLLPACVELCTLNIILINHAM